MTDRNPNNQTPNQTDIIVKAMQFGGLVMMMIGVGLYLYDMKMIGIILVVFGSIESAIMPKIIKNILNKKDKKDKRN